MRQGDPAYLPTATVGSSGAPSTTGYVVVVAGAGPTDLLTRITGGSSGSAANFAPAVALRRLECSCVVAGTGDFLITSQLSQGGSLVLTTLGGFTAVGVVGTHLTIDFPIALKGQGSILIELTGAGTWNVTPNGWAST